MSYYRDRIAALCEADPALVEAWMRLECGTLDALTRERFAAEVKIGAALVAYDPEASRELARSYGLIERGER